MSADLLAVAFASFAALLAAVLVATLWRWLPRRAAALGTVALLAWLVYVGAIGASGLLRDVTLRPPGIFLLALPAIAFAVFAIARGAIGLRLASAIPVAWLLGLQVYRVGVEAVLQALFEAGRVPRLMTLAGGNVEIVVALAAPVAAWLSTRAGTGRRLALVWNVVGLLSLLNVVARGVLTAPGPLQIIQAEVPNQVIGWLPYSYIPGMMVPLALVLHLLAFRALRANTRN